MSEPELRRTRDLQPSLRRATEICGLALIVAGALYAMNIHLYAGLRILSQQYFGLAMGVSLFITFLLFPAARAARRDKAPWYDIALALAGLACGAYVMILFPRLAIRLADINWHKVLFGALSVILVIEACRRLFGWILPTIAVLFIAYAAFASYAPGMFRTRSISPERLSVDLLLSDQGMLGTIMGIVATVVLVYVLFGHLLFSMGGGKLFTDLALAALGRYRGGPAKVAVLGSSFFGSISNSAVANVMITGSVTIPMMKRIGYKPTAAGAIEATASTGGLITPPVMSAVAFVMAEYLQIPYGQVVIAAAIPAALFYAALLIQVDLEAGRTGMKGLPPEEIPRVRDVLRHGWPFLIPLPILVYTLVWLLWQPETAGMLAVLILVVSGFWFVRKNPLIWWYRMVAGAGIQVSEIIVVGLLVGAILSATSMTGLSFTMTEPLLLIGDISSLLLLAATALISLILGMGLPGIAIYFMQVTLIVPALVEFGITPIAAHFFIFYFGVFSLITPPVAVAAVAASGIARSSPMLTAWEATKFGVVAYIIPFVFVYSPTLLAQGPPMLVAVNCLTAAVGVLAISVSLRGYLMSPVGPGVRLVLFAAAVGLFVPVDAAPILPYVNAASLVVACLLMGANYVAAQRVTRKTAAA